MVGLRWWNKINDDGTNEWVYESLDVRAIFQLSLTSSTSLSSLMPLIPLMPLTPYGAA